MCRHLHGTSRNRGNCWRGYLVGLLANAGRKKLTTLVLGTDQQRALHQAATTDVDRTAEQLASAGGDQAEQLAMVVSEVFRDPPSDLLGQRC